MIMNTDKWPLELLFLILLLCKICDVSSYAQHKRVKNGILGVATRVSVSIESKVWPDLAL